MMNQCDVCGSKEPPLIVITLAVPAIDKRGVEQSCQQHQLEICSKHPTITAPELMTEARKTFSLAAWKNHLNPRAQHLKLDFAAARIEAGVDVWS